MIVTAVRPPPAINYLRYERRRGGVDWSFQPQGICRRIYSSSTGNSSRQPTTPAPHSPTHIYPTIEFRGRRIHRPHSTPPPSRRDDDKKRSRKGIRRFGENLSGSAGIIRGFFARTGGEAKLIPNSNIVLSADLPLG